MSFSFFGVQVAFKQLARDPLSGQLHHLLARDAVPRQSITDKLRFWKHVSALLRPAEPAFEYGDWDLVRSGDAESQFREWSGEIETGFMIRLDDDATVHEGPRDAGSPSYVIATMIALVERGSNADETLRLHCDLPESEWLTRATFAQLISIFPRLNFANVQADAIYLAPGRGREGPTAADLESEDYRLKRLT